MSNSTRATAALDKAGVSYTVHTYAYDPNADHIGLHAADCLGVATETVLKTIMAQVDGRPVCVIMPSDKEVSMKRLAAACGGKSAQMLRPADAERLTGYHVGGISPFGQRKPVPTIIEVSALDHEAVFLNGGKRGLQIRLRPEDAQAVSQAKPAPVVA